MRGEAVWASQDDVVKLMVIKRRRVNAAGVRRRQSFLFGEISAGPFSGSVSWSVTSAWEASGNKVQGVALSR